VNDLDFTGKAVMISGAASGIGLAIAQRFAAAGADLELVDRNAEALAAAAQAFPETSRVTLHSADLMDASGVAAIGRDLQDRRITLHALVNNAGAEYPTPIASDESDGEARWQALLDNNVASMFRLTRMVLPFLAPGSSIINQSSIWGKTGVAEFSAYVASKHAIIGLTRSLAWELGPRRIRVNAVCPGWVGTAAALRSLSHIAESTGRSEDAVRQEILSHQAIPELLEPEDIAPTFLFLASDLARPITGQSIVVSNGEVMG
jgi:3-hydroxybutyrate dehydrogenase